MSEKEIIKKIKDTIQYDKEHRIETIYDEKPLFRDYLQGLLDLYDKEKDKYYELLEKYAMKKLLFIRKNNNTKQMISKYYIKKDELDKNYISKDKIRATIKKLENGTYDAKIILQKLLEGE